MTRDEVLERISIDPRIRFGKPCIRACIAYGAEMSRERYVELPLGAPA
jgi:uncharacterized protein (DUF433 family)